MGLLDILNTDDGRFGLGLLAAAAPRTDGAGFGQRLNEAVGSVDQFKRQKLLAKLQELQMQEAESSMADKQAQRAQGQTNQAGVMGMVKQGAGFDPRAFLEANPGVDLAGLQQAMQMNSAMNPAPKYETLAPGASLYKMGPNGPELSMHAPKEASIPSAIQEYQFAKGEGFKGNFEQWDTARKRAGASSVSVNTGQKGLDNTLKLRSDFRSEPIYKAHQEVQSAYSQIQQALKMASPVGDLAGATKIMKLLDPGSVVRESELGMAMAASGAMDRLTNYASNVMSGNKLTPAQRKDFQTLADALYQESGKQYNNKRSEYQGIAERNGLSVPDVLGNPVQAQPRGGKVVDFGSLK
jgi:hypothetical protein